MESNITTEIFLPAALFIIMLGMGLSLVTHDFKRIALYPKAVLVGLANQLFVVPVVGFTVATIFPLRPELAVGILIISACPGGPTSNLISYLSKGDTALSITLTAVSSIITIFTIPFLVNFALLHFLNEGQAIQLDITKTILQIIIITIVPVSIGMYIRKKNSRAALKMEKPVKTASALLLFLVIAAVLLKEKNNVGSFFLEIGLPVLILNVTTMAIGYFSARALQIQKPQSIAISIESGIQNGTLGIVIAGSILMNIEMTIPSAIYGLVMFISGGGMILLFGSKRRQKVAIG